MGESVVTHKALVSGEARLKKHLNRPLQTPGDVLEFWFDDCAASPEAMQTRHELWFKKSDATDRLIAQRGVDVLARLASGEARKWADKGPAERLAAIVALDQFTRNIFRTSGSAFENDALALELCKDGLDKGEDKVLSPVRRWFFYMPLEHSEDLADQERCVGLLKDLIKAVDDDHRPLYESALDYARKHREVVEKYGRFPHRNALLGRTSTAPEKDYLAKPGAGF